MKYAIKVPFDDDWLFVTKSVQGNPEIVLYNTREEAVENAQIWGGNGVVVEYQENGEN